MTSLASHEGYLLIDDTASGGKKLEAATITCVHCQTTFLKNPDRVRPRNFCAKCSAYVCDNPACSANCRPFWKLIEDQQTLAIHQQINAQL